MKLRKLLCSFLAVIIAASSLAGLSVVTASAASISELKTVVYRINQAHRNRFNFSSVAWKNFIDEVLDIQRDYPEYLDFVIPSNVDDLSNGKQAPALCLSVYESTPNSTSALERLVSRLENAYNTVEASPVSPTPERIQEIIDFLDDLDSDTRESYRKTMTSEMKYVANLSKDYLEYGDRNTYISIASIDNIPNTTTPVDVDNAYNELLDVYDYYFFDEKATAPTVSLKQVSKDLQVRNVKTQNDCTADTTGKIFYYKKGINDTVAFYVYDKAGCTSTVTINGEEYTSGADYVIEQRQSLYITVKTEQEGKSYNVKNYLVRVTEDYYTGSSSSDGTSNRDPSIIEGGDNNNNSNTENNTSPSVGWTKTEQGWKYSVDGKNVTGWVKDTDGKWYYINPSTEIMATGWIYTGGKWYFLRSDGSMLTGWLLNGGKWYYMNASGAMATHWSYVGGKWYYLFDNGQMATGWLANGGKWYYMDASGAMVTSTQLIGGTRYVFNQSGALV